MSIAACTIVISFSSARKKTTFYNHLNSAPSFKEYLDGDSEKVIFLRFPTITFRSAMMDTLKKQIVNYRIVTHNGQEQLKIK